MPDPTTTHDPLDAELRRIAQALVAEAPDSHPPIDGDPGTVLAEWVSASRSRRPVVAVAAVAASALILVVGAVAVTLKGNGSTDSSEDEVVTLGPSAGLEDGPQRLFIYHGEFQPIHELTPDGELLAPEVAGLDLGGTLLPLADGGHVVVGSREEPASSDGEEFVYGLAVVAADGEVEVERAIDRSWLVGLTETQAILAREPDRSTGALSAQPTGPINLYSHDLATGEERLVYEEATPEPARELDQISGMTSARVMAIVGGDLVAVESESMLDLGDSGGKRTEPLCTLQVTDLASGDVIESSLDIDCSGAGPMQASPDGSRLALVYDNSLLQLTEPMEVARPELRLAVVDLPSGTVRHDQRLGDNASYNCEGDTCPPESDPVSYSGMAWNDNSSIRLATTIEPSAPDEEATVQTINVP